MATIKLKDAGVGSQVIWNGFKSWVLLYDPPGYGNMTLIGWKQNEPFFQHAHKTKLSGGVAQGSVHGINLDSLAVKENLYYIFWLSQNTDIALITRQVVIKPQTFTFNTPKDNKPDGMFCAGGCQQFYPMAQANRPSGKMVCYSCRQGWLPPGV